MTTSLTTTASRTHPPRIDALVRAVDRRLAQLLQPREGTPRVLHEAMRYCVLNGGKRFRPLVCLGGCEAVGGQVRQALPVACAVELIHSYSLVHDDLPAMDDADQRRGQPSCHRRFGEGAAILVGDALLTRAFEVLSANGTPNTLAILRTIGQASGTTGLIGGQVLDLRLEPRRRKSETRHLEDIARRKTAALITASVVAGGLAGGGRQRALNALRRFGERLGLAFQLKDDLHDGDGLVRAVGREAVEARARRLIDQATQELNPFGQRADVLRALAQWLART